MCNCTYDLLIKLGFPVTAIKHSSNCPVDKLDNKQNVSQNTSK